MLFKKPKAGLSISSLLSVTIILLISNFIACNNDPRAEKKGIISTGKQDTIKSVDPQEEYNRINAILVLPRNPRPGDPFRIMATGSKDISEASIIVSGASVAMKSIKSKTGDQIPAWRIDDFQGGSAGRYKASLVLEDKSLCDLEFEISAVEPAPGQGVVWKTIRGWDSGMEIVYSAWINSLFYTCNENSSWTALHEVTRNPAQNFLYNYLSLGEDEMDKKNILIMQPDCADNPFFLRAYFAWKLGLPFAYHVCDRGSLNHNPRTGQFISNEAISSEPDQIKAFNNFLRRVKDGIHSGTARTALDDENSDYYPVPLETGALRPGIVYADPYGHTLILIGRVSQTNKNSGLLLSVDAQPDGTVGIKRFWKGNFLFNTSGVIGEPGFKAFRPIEVINGVLKPVQNKELTGKAGYIPYSEQQRKMTTDVFYHSMERIINPDPLDPEAALTGLIEALHEQLMVRITSVANGEAYFKMHPGTLVAMPSSASGIFQAGGQWEDFSTPNRDLRLMIAMDAVLEFPDMVTRSPEDFNISKSFTPEQLKIKLQSILNKKGNELSVTYTRSDGTMQLLTINELLQRRDAFEMAYNPNDGVEIRWGAPENSNELSTCRRRAPKYQVEKMLAVRQWFNKRLHPPT
jgi:hypothetical protein